MGPRALVDHVVSGHGGCMDLRWRQFLRLSVAPPTSGLFVHDFVRVELPYDAVIGAFAYFVSPELIGEIVADAWRCETSEAGRVLAIAESGTQPSVEVRLGPRRSRRGALVIPISWQAGSTAWVPSLQADLEVVSFGPDRTHLHILGLSWLPPESVPGSDRASLDHRLTVALVRHVLVSLADTLVAEVPDLASASPSHPRFPDEDRTP